MLSKARTEENQLQLEREKLQFAREKLQAEKEMLNIRLQIAQLKTENRTENRYERNVFSQTSDFDLDFE